MTRLTSVEDSHAYFHKAVDIWDSAWDRTVRLQTASELLENKALALLCLGKKEEAIDTMRKSSNRRLAEDVTDWDIYNLLVKSPKPPEGINEMIDLLKNAS